jgi:hypothetical protein
MSENKNTVDLFLTEAKTLEGRRQELIRSLLTQRETAIREYDSQLTKLGYKAEVQKRSHHKRMASGMLKTATEIVAPTKTQPS